MIKNPFQQAILFCALVVASSPSHPQKGVKPKAHEGPTQEYSFMGLASGQSESEAKAIIDGLNVNFSELEELEPPTCSNTLKGLSGPGLNACFFSVKYAALPAYSRSHSFVLLFVDGRLARADYGFDQNEYESMVTSIVKKYGKPTDSKLVNMSNGFGATIQSRNYEWKSGSYRLGASEVGNTSEKSNVHIEDQSLMEEFDKRVRENGPKI